MKMNDTKERKLTHRQALIVKGDFLDEVSALDDDFLIGLQVQHNNVGHGLAIRVAAATVNDAAQ